MGSETIIITSTALYDALEKAEIAYKLAYQIKTANDRLNFMEKTNIINNAGYEHLKRLQLKKAHELINMFK